MSLSWHHESNPTWDEPKATIVGGAPAGTFPMEAHASGAPLPGDWWRVEDDGAVVGYGWMDTTWGDAEILLAVDPAQRRHGVGTYVLDQLEHEAATRGLNYLFNTVSPEHPEREAVTAWLQARKFAPSGEGTLRRPAHR